jgi:hypothetical protein
MRRLPTRSRGKRLLRNPELRCSKRIPESFLGSPTANSVPSMYWCVLAIQSSSNVYVVLLPGKGEMIKSSCVKLARKQAILCDYSTPLIGTAPFFASRRPRSQNLFFTKTVSDQLLQVQSLAIINEEAMPYAQRTATYTLTLSSNKWRKVNRRNGRLK